MRMRDKLNYIKEIAQGMYDWWINKSPYEDKERLANHLLTTELRRILNLFNEDE